MGKGIKKKLQLAFHQRALIPDLLAIPASDFHIQKVRVRGREIVLLRLSQSFGNIGQGPLQFRRGYSDRLCRGPRRAAGYQDIFFTDGSKKSVRLKECMIYHPQHGYWHIANVARYDLHEAYPITGRAGRSVLRQDYS
jgi:hypothetical protein